MHSSNKSYFTRFIDVAILITFIATTILISIILIRVFVYSRFILGTEIAGVDVSRKSTSEAQQLITEKTEEVTKTQLSFLLDGVTKRVSLEEAGVTPLIEETIKKAEEKNNQEAELFKYIISQKKQIATSIIVSIDKEKLTKILDKEYNLTELKPSNAWYEFDKQGKLTVLEGKNGLTIDEDQLIKDLKTSLENPENNQVEIKLLDTPPTLTTEELERQKSGIIEMIRHRMTLTHPEYRNKWTLSLVDHLDWIKFSTKQKITFEPTDNSFVLEKFPKVEIPGFSTKTYLTIEIEEEKLNEYIDAKMAQYLDNPVEDVNISQDKEGKITIEGKGNNGKQIKRNFFKKAIEIAVNQKITLVPVPVQEIEPTVTVSDELRAQGIKEIVAVGHTTYYGSPLNRIYNIEVGANRINGTIIKKGEEFDFNKTIGPVDGRSGYLMELVIKPEGTIPEYGGGLCQVSTTVYRSALFAGVPITERHQHSYAVTYYSQVLGHGLDATVYIGGPGLKFKNDTEGDILLQSYIKNKHELYIVLYGTKDGRSVKMDGPYISNKTHPSEVLYQEVQDLPLGVQKKIEAAHVGFNALWYRYVTMPDGEEKKEEIYSKYRTMPAKVLVGTGE